MMSHRNLSDIYSWRSEAAFNHPQVVDAVQLSAAFGGEGSDVVLW